jgi:hypothetical protein
MGLEHLKLLDTVESVCYTTSMSSEPMNFPDYVVFDYHVKAKQFHSQMSRKGKIIFYGDFVPGDYVKIYTTPDEENDS